jgi:hypothetical protein
MNRTSDSISTNRHTDFIERLTSAIAELKGRLQAHYERAHPSQRELVRRAIDEAEALAWKLSSFPHLLLPDLVEVRMEQLALQPAFAGAEPAFARAA